MPLVNVKLVEGVLPDEKKKDMIAGITEAMVGVYGENIRPVTWVVLEEVKSGDWGVGGTCLTTQAVRDLIAQKQPASV